VVLDTLAPAERLAFVLQVVFGFTMARGKIVAIELLADPERLRQLDLVVIENPDERLRMRVARTPQAGSRQEDRNQRHQPPCVDLVCREDAGGRERRQHPGRHPPVVSDDEPIEELSKPSRSRQNHLHGYATSRIAR
jgi:hypothetical protein